MHSSAELSTVQAKKNFKANTNMSKTLHLALLRSTLSLKTIQFQKCFSYSSNRLVCSLIGSDTSVHLLACNLDAHPFNELACQMWARWDTRAVYQIKLGKCIMFLSRLNEWLPKGGPPFGNTLLLFFNAYLSNSRSWDWYDFCSNSV